MGLLFTFKIPPRGQIPSKLVILQNGFTASKVFAGKEGYFVEGAYASICKDRGLIGGMNKMTATLTIRKSQQNEFVLAHDSFEFVPDLGSTKNLVEQAYEAAKKLEKYENAQDA
jgi:hypothetical protein